MRNMCQSINSRKAIVDDKGIKDSWKDYMEKLMNEENEWDHKLTAKVKEGPADYIKMDEVRAALKEIKGIKPLSLIGFLSSTFRILSSFP